MKRIVFMVGLMFLVGCTYVEGEEAYAGNHTEKNDSLYIKRSILRDIDLINEQDGSRLSIRLNDYGYLKGSLDLSMLEKLAKGLAEEIDTPMRNPSINEVGQISTGQKQIILSESELIENIVNLAEDATELILPIYVTEPTVTVEQLVGIDKKVLAEYQTRFNPQVLGRSKNIELSAAAIKDYVLGPGDEFSFNRVVGQRTIERGYQEAKEIVNKEFVLGIGGGICQTSSTLFNAVEAAGLEIIERSSHSREVGYVAKGRDATVSWGGPDFRFRNNLDYPILIRTDISHKNGVVIVKVLTQARDY